MTRRVGFTLPEVLATLVLVGLVLPVVMQGISLSMRASSDAGRRTEAASLAETKLAELALMGDTIREMSGDFGPDFPGYRWTRDEASADDGMVEVTVHVQWETRGEPRVLSLSTWRSPDLAALRAERAVEAGGVSP